MRRRTLLRAVGVGTGTGLLGFAGAGLDAGGDAAVPRDPTYREVARWSIPDYGNGWGEIWPFSRILHDVTVVGGYAYCAFWEAGAWILDVSDPSSPTFVGRAGDYSLSELRELSSDTGRRQRAYLESPGNAHYVEVDDDATLMAVGAEGWNDPYTDARGPGGIDLYDVADPASPERLSTIEAPFAADETRNGTWTTAHNFELLGDRLYSAWYQGGVKVHDVSDPANPRLLSWWRDPDVARFWTARVVEPGEYFVASSYPHQGTRGGLYVFPDRAGRQSDPPTLVAPDSDRSNPRPSDTGEPFEPLGSVDVEGAAEAVVDPDGRTAYLAASDGFAVVDVSDPADPSVVAQRRDILADREGGPLSSVLDVAVDGERLLVPAPAQSGVLQGFLLYDVSDPADPSRVGDFFEVDSSIHNADLSDGYAYLTANGMTGQPLVVVDVREGVGTTTTTVDPGTTTTVDPGTSGSGGGTTGTAGSDGGGDGSGGESTPGFGALVGAGALGLGAYRYLRRADED